MIKVNMHEAKTRLSALVKAVEEQGQIVTICRHGKPVAVLQPSKPVQHRRLVSDASLRVTLAPGFDPVEPLRDDEIPAEYR
jgi:prevent-host-death family protein